ncbi:hypothetical protein D3C73_691710 [compost metagenome]
MHHACCNEEILNLCFATLLLLALYQIAIEIAEALDVHVFHMPLQIFFPTLLIAFPSPLYPQLFILSFNRQYDKVRR